MFEGDGRRHHAGQIGVVELGGVPEPLVWHEFKILACPPVSVAGGEVGEGHPVGAANACVLRVHGAGETMRRQPFHQCARFKEGTIDKLGRSAQNAVKADGVGGHGENGSPDRSDAREDFRQIIGQLLKGATPAALHPLTRGVEGLALVLARLVGPPVHGDSGLTVFFCERHDREQLQRPRVLWPGAPPGP